MAEAEAIGLLEQWPGTVRPQEAFSSPGAATKALETVTRRGDHLRPGVIDQAIQTLKKDPGDVFLKCPVAEIVEAIARSLHRSHRKIRWPGWPRLLASRSRQ
eukprot:s9450_g3.t1